MFLTSGVARDPPQRVAERVEHAGVAEEVDAAAGLRRRHLQRRRRRHRDGEGLDHDVPGDNLERSVVLVCVGVGNHMRLVRECVTGLGVREKLCVYVCVSVCVCVCVCLCVCVYDGNDIRDAPSHLPHTM